MDFSKPETVLDLSNIRSTLIRLEDTILFDIIERAQFCRSSKVYERGAFPKLGPDLSFLEYILRETERLHSKLRRYEAPDENIFFPDAAEPSLLPPLPYPPALSDYSKEVSVNDRIYEYYTQKIVPAISASAEEQPENYGSCALADVQILQALSRRIHFGKFVAEAKFQQDPEGMSKLIRARDTEGIVAAITKPEVEQQILRRVHDKADQYALDPHTMLRWSERGQGKVDPNAIVHVYENCVIPLTKDVEVEYLLRRLD